jgi:hypothetical protein
LATTTAPDGRSSQAWRQRWATWRTSLLRSSWSRLRLSKTMAAGWTWAETRPNHASSTSSTAGAPGRRWPPHKAVARPVGRLAPVRLVTTSVPAVAARAPASNRVVVVLPLVPETRTTWCPAENIVKARGSMAMMAWPPMTEPEPRPLARDRPANPVPTNAASLARHGNEAAGSTGRGRAGGGGTGWAGCRFVGHATDCALSVLALFSQQVGGQLRASL